MRRRNRWLAAVASGLAIAAGTTMAAEIRINNLDVGTRQGLSDPTPATPVGGNPGRTRGEQARLVLEYAAQLWGAVLKSPVPIDIDASFSRLDCAPDTAFVGSAYAQQRFLLERDVSGIRARVWHPVALANALKGEDVSPGKADIRMDFNGDLGKPDCIPNFPWYFGLEGDAPDSESLLKTVLHEMAHGLGFAGFGNLRTGRPAVALDGIAYPDIYSIHVHDNAKGKGWYEMSDAERVKSALNDGHLVFGGPHVKAHAPLALGKRDALEVTLTGTGTREYAFRRERFGPVARPGSFTGVPVLAGVRGNAEACAPLGNAAAVAGHIAIVDDGSCDARVKARFAKAAGAIGMIIVDNPRAVAPPPASGEVEVTIPVITIAQADGAELKGNLAGARIEMRSVPGGIDAAGNVQLYAPRSLKEGSSFAHFDFRLSPNVLMQPIAGRKGGAYQLDLDLTPSLLMDEGWSVNDGGQLLGLCDTGVPTWLPGGVVVGAHIAAMARIFASTSATAGGYAASMRNHAARLARDGLLTAAQASSLNACLDDAKAAEQYASWRQGGIGDPAVIELTSGRLMSRQAGTAGSERIYRLTVPEGARMLNIRTFGGTGDVSLLVNVGSEPTASNYKYRSVHPGNSESVISARAEPGSYFIKVVGVTPYAGLYVQATYSK